MAEEKIEVRGTYEHLSGVIYYCAGIAKMIKQKNLEEKEYAVMIALDDGLSMWTTPVETFFDKHPETQVSRFTRCKVNVKK